jgi:rod shape-determining protein MreC
VRALRDQFQTTTPSSRKLLPASIVGFKGIIQGSSAPSELIIDKGRSDAVVVGQVVMYKDTVIGTISKVSEHLSRITVVSHADSSFTGKTAKTNALGVIEGQGNGVMLLKNVVLSEKLRVGDLVLTKGDVDLDGKGYPPDLIVGKIVKIERKPSALFQSAEVRSTVNFSKLTDVFVITQK